MHDYVVGVARGNQQSFIYAKIHEMVIPDRFAVHQFTTYFIDSRGDWCEYSERFTTFADAMQFVLQGIAPLRYGQTITIHCSA